MSRVIDHAQQSESFKGLFFFFNLLTSKLMDVSRVQAACRVWRHALPFNSLLVVA